MSSWILSPSFKILSCSQKSHTAHRLRWVEGARRASLRAERWIARVGIREHFLKKNWRGKKIQFILCRLGIWNKKVKCKPKEKGI
jgi:hypothetical protein